MQPAGREKPAGCIFMSSKTIKTDLTYFFIIPFNNLEDSGAELQETVSIGDYSFLVATWMIK